MISETKKRFIEMFPMHCGARAGEGAGCCGWLISYSLNKGVEID